MLITLWIFQVKPNLNRTLSNRTEVEPKPKSIQTIPKAEGSWALVTPGSFDYKLKLSQIQFEIEPKNTSKLKNNRIRTKTNSKLKHS